MNNPTLLDPKIIEALARYRTQYVIALIAAKGESTEGLEEDAFALFLALEQSKAERMARTIEAVAS